MLTAFDPLLTVSAMLRVTFSQIRTGRHTCWYVPLLILLGRTSLLSPWTSRLHIGLPWASSRSEIIQERNRRFIVVSHDGRRCSSGSLFQNFEHQCRRLRAVGQSTQNGPKVGRRHYFAS